MKKLVASFALMALTAVATAGEPVALFDGKSLDGWSAVDFAGKGETKIKPGGILEIGMGSLLTGVVYTSAPPARMNYEITLDARRTMGSDFFCGLTFPVESNCCTLILGGWGGNLTGMSSIDGMDAAENETTGNFEFETDHWYAIRLKVTTGKIEAWIGEKKIVNVTTEERRLGMRPGDIELCMPLGIATWQTRGEIRNLRLKKLE